MTSCFASLLYADDKVMFASSPQQPVTEYKVVRLGTKTYISKAFLPGGFSFESWLGNEILPQVKEFTSNQLAYFPVSTEQPLGVLPSLTFVLQTQWLLLSLKK